MKEFKPTSWAIDNRTSVFIIILLISLAGVLSYISIPKEQFPDVTVPQIFVTTIYPGASPSDMEQLITKPLEKQLKGLTGVKKITSSSSRTFQILLSNSIRIWMSHNASKKLKMELTRQLVIYLLTCWKIQLSLNLIFLRSRS
jgi:Na+/pantothenate symporter